MKIMAKKYTVTSLEALKLLCSIINKTVDLPNTVISDTSIATNTTYSSYKLDKEFDTLEDELKHYTDTAIAGLNKLTKEIINDKALVVKDNVLYLYKAADDPSNDYMQMMLINGVAVELGSTQVDMSDYYNKADSDNRFAAKLDLTTLTNSVNDKIDKASILTANDPSATDDQVYSAKAINAELDVVVKKTDISTTINSASTDDTVPSSKAVYDNTLGEAINSSDKYGSDILYFPCGIYRITSDVLASSFVNLPKAHAGLLYVTSIHPNNTLDKAYSYRTFRYETHLGNNYYRSIYTDSVAGVIVYDTGWKRLCTTSVADVPRTVITSENTSITLNQNCVYEVINGICYVSLWGFQSNITGQYVICNSMPKTKFTMQGVCCYGSSGDTGASIFITNDGINDTRLFTEIHVIDQKLYGSFSYPVAES